MLEYIGPIMAGILSFFIAPVTIVPVRVPDTYVTHKYLLDE